MGNRGINDVDVNICQRKVICISGVSKIFVVLPALMLVYFLSNAILTHQVENNVKKLNAFTEDIHFAICLSFR